MPYRFIPSVAMTSAALHVLFRPARNIGVVKRRGGTTKNIGVKATTFCTTRWRGRTAVGLPPHRLACVFCFAIVSVNGVRYEPSRGRGRWTFAMGARNALGAVRSLRHSWRHTTLFI